MLSYTGDVQMVGCWNVMKKEENAQIDLEGNLNDLSCVLRMCLEYL